MLSLRTVTYIEIYDPEVFLQSMTHKDDTGIQQAPQLLVSSFECCEVFQGSRGVKVAGLDTRELGQVVYNLETE